MNTEDCDKITIEGLVEVPEGRISAENVHIAGIALMDVLSRLFKSRQPQSHGRWKIVIENLNKKDP